VKRFRNVTRNNIETPPDTETDTETDTEKKIKTLTSESYKSDPCPHQDIIDLYHKHCPSLPAIKSWTARRQTMLRTRWKESTDHQTLLFWDDFFALVSRSDFLMGRAREWRADLEWLLKASNFVKVIEGKYDNRNGSQHKKSQFSEIAPRQDYGPQYKEVKLD
jgi:hypothetical protein